jgi:hypothetical protein
MAGSEATPLDDLRRALLAGAVIPAHPLALTADRRLDERRQVALTRYYCDAGAGGLAVGVHTTQFAIRDPKVGLLEPVLELAVRSRSRLVRRAAPGHDRRRVRADAAGARRGPSSRRRSATMRRCSVSPRCATPHEALLEHCRHVAAVLPARRLLPAAGRRRARARPPLLARLLRHRARGGRQGRALRPLPHARRRRRPGRERPPRRRALHGQRRRDRGRPADAVSRGPHEPPLRFSGGLLGQWAVWTRGAVDLLRRCQAIAAGAPADAGRCSAAIDLLALGAELTDVNGALFDPAHHFAGCIPGIHEVLRRQRLLAGRWCLDPHEDLSPGQAEAIDRVLARYPHLSDDAFVAEHLERWHG